MTTRRNDRTANLYHALQAARRARGWDAATYYGRLSSILGRTITSTRELSRAEAARCLDDINGRSLHQPHAPRDSRPAMLDAIHRRLGVLTGADGRPLTAAYAEAILRRQRGIADAAVACPLACGDSILATAEELRGVIAALDRYAARQERRTTPAAAPEPRA